MEKKNKKMLLVVSVLLLLGGISFAYFVGTSLFNGTGSKTEGITASIKGATINVEGKLAFNDLDILPGHQTISSIKVTATGNNELISYNLIWNGTNNLNTPLEFKVYKTSNEVDISVTCEKKTKVENGYQILNEECSISNLDKLGEVISTGTIEKTTGAIKVVLASDEFITATNDGDTKYYYVILEYPNLDEDQSEDMGGSFEGTVTVEESNAKPDINILAVQIEQEDGTYQDSDDIPQSGYHLNKTNSVCSNGAIPGWDTSNNRFYADNLTKSGTSCYLYFDRPKCNGLTCTTILANTTYKDNLSNFSTPATTDEGIFKTQDDDGDTYYWRGAVENNYVKFANKFWRIIRINGDGTIRLIYDGTSARSNGTSSTDTQIGKSAFNTNYNNNIYVGFKYSINQANEGSSSILGILENWYNSNLKYYEDKIDKSAGFCGDRTPSTSSSTIDGQNGTNTTTYYGAYIRLYTNKSPSLECPTKDFYTTISANKGNKSLTYPIGLINADEAAIAGGVAFATNKNYYLYIGQAYWTLSPYNYDRVEAEVFIIDKDGEIASDRYTNGVSYAHSVRPVINLRSDVKLTGTGTINDPYVVVEEN